MIQNEKVNIYYGSKDAYDFEKQNKRIDENALYFIEGVLYSGYELYSQDYKKVSSYPSIGQKNCIYINTTDSSVAIWDYDKNEWIYLCMPASNEIINNSNSIATSSAVYKVLQNTKEYTDKKCNEISESLTDTLNTAIENSIVDYNKNLFAESDKYNSISDIENAIDDITNRESVLQFSIEEEKNRAITAESEVKNTIETNKPIWDDKYTKVEIDNKFSAFETNIDWKEAVDTYSKIATTYPNAEDGWTVNVKDTNYTYRYNGDEWVPISANAIPKATNDVDGLLSKEDHAKYEEAYSQKHSHSNKSILDTITSTLIDAWNSAVTHISDTVKHITSNERTNWNDANDKKHTHSNKSILDSITASYTTEEKTKLSGIATGANKYTHPSYTARTGVPTANQTPAFGGTFTVTQPVSDATGHITGMNSRTVTIPSAAATTSVAGLMSASDKTKLNGIASGANKTTLATNLTTSTVGYALDATMGKDLYSYVRMLQSDVVYLKYLTNTLTEDFVEAKYIKNHQNSELGNINYAYMPYEKKSALTTSNKVIVGFSNGAVGIFSVDYAAGSNNQLGRTITWIKDSVPYVAKATIQSGTNTLALASSSGAYTVWDDEIYKSTGELKYTLVFEISAASSDISVFYKIININDGFNSLLETETDVLM